MIEIEVRISVRKQTIIIFIICIKKNDRRKIIVSMKLSCTLPDCNKSNDHCGCTACLSRIRSYQRIKLRMRTSESARMTSRVSSVVGYEPETRSRRRAAQNGFREKSEREPETCDGYRRIAVRCSTWWLRRWSHRPWYSHRVIPLAAFASRRRRATARARAKKNYPSLPTRARVVNYILGIGFFATSNDAVSYLR